MSTNPASVPSPRFKLRIQATPESTQVICSGKLTTEIAAEFKQEVRALLPQTKRIVLDLGDVVFMDSAGLGAIIGVYVTARKAQCDFQLVNISKKIRALLDMTHVLSVFESTGQIGGRML